MSVSAKNRNGKTAELCYLLRKDILRGRYEPGAALPSSRMLSEQYGVAEGTAAAAVGHLAHEGWAVRIRGRGSFVAEQLPAQHKMLDFLRIRDMLGNRDGAHELKWIEEFCVAAKQDGWTPQWHHVCPKEIENAERFAEQFRDSNGLISYGCIPQELLFELCRRDIPLVCTFLGTGAVTEQPTRYAQISFDRRECARRATEHLIGLGYTQIAFIGLSILPMRTIGFLDAIGAAGLPNQAQWLIHLQTDILLSGGQAFQRCRELCEKILKGDNRPEAFCCSTRRTAHCLARLALDMGLRIPEDLAIIACDETLPDVSAELGITTVAVSRPESCRKALEVLKQQEPGEPRLSNPIMMPLHLTVEDSCGAKLKGRAVEHGQSEDCKEKSA